MLRPLFRALASARSFHALELSGWDADVLGVLVVAGVMRRLHHLGLELGLVSRRAIEAVRAVGASLSSLESLRLCFDDHQLHDSVRREIAAIFRGTSVVVEASSALERTERPCGPCGAPKRWASCAVGLSSYECGAAADFVWD